EVAPPGFLNFVLDPATVRQLLSELLKKEAKFFRAGKPSGHKAIIEFVSANPTGPLSIAHGRQAVVGDVIASLLKFTGTEVTREYYINDAGRQTDLLSQSVACAMDDKPVPEDGYHGGYIKDIATSALADSGYKADPKNFDIKEFSLSGCLDWIKNDLNALGVHFDTWVSQQKDVIDKSKIDKALEFLAAKGLTFEEEDALWFSSTKFGDDKDRVIKKSDGELTYFASDIAYHKDKIERGFDTIINLWGPDHHGYIPRVASAIEALGLDRKALEVIIIQLVTIKSKGRMSKRKGTAILLSELIEEVGKDAARFYYLRRKNASHLEFDVDLAQAKSFDNPLYYIQYAHARICSIIAKYASEVGPLDDLDLNSVDRLGEEGELALIKEALQFKNVVVLAASQREPYAIVDYLGTLAAAFHKFYEVYKVVDKADPVLSGGRILLIKAVKIVLALGLSLLGVDAPEKM
ncbi:arginine--tRNA ligase, partial [Candidatus Omnitrophota bacterium]